MQISQFARACGLTPDTVRFYVRRGLLTPEVGDKGGRNPYQVFTPHDVETARLIRLAQSLGFTLREISAINAEFQSDGITHERAAALMRERLVVLDEKAAQIAAVSSYIRAKLDWMEQGGQGPEPQLSTHLPAVGVCVARPLAP